MAGEKRVRQLGLLVCAWAAAAGLTPAAGSQGRAELVFRQVAMSGQAAPGGAESTVFAELDSPCIDANGQVAFRARLAGPGVDATNNYGIWSGRTGSLTLVVRRGDPAPGTEPGVRFGSIPFSPAIGSGGHVAFKASLTSASGGSWGIWSDRSGALGLVAREGQQAPDTREGVVFSELYNPMVDARGHAAFMSRVTGTDVGADNDYGIWSQGTGSLRLVAREGDPAPDTAAGVTFALVDSPALSDAGALSFRGGLRGSGVNSTNDEGIWSEGTGSVRLVSRSGERPPGMTSGVKFDSYSTSVLNAAGRIAFSAQLTGTGITSTNKRTLWSDGSGSLALVARTGDLAPGTSPPVRFSSGWYSLRLNSEGRCAFTTMLEGTVGGAVFAEGPEGLRLVARAGGPAPGTAPGVTFAFIDPTDESLAFNAKGQTAFVASLAGPGVNSSNDNGLWAEIDGNLELIVREGDELEVAPNVFRAVDILHFQSGWSNEYGRPVGLNDAGQLAFKALLTDGTTGIFTAVPEPSMLSLLALGACVPLLRTRAANKRRPPAGRAS